MAGYEPIRSYEIRRDEYVENVSIGRTDDSAYPSGWKYSMHFGRTDGTWYRRYDNAHEDTKGHELHTHDSDGPILIEFPGMGDLYVRWQREIDPHRPDEWPSPTSTETGDDQL